MTSYFNFNLYNIFKYAKKKITQTNKFKLIKI